MRYSKPKKIRYVDMAIWIDNNAYTDGCNESMLYDYLYHLAKMLSYKRGLCATSREYDDFSIWCASKYFFRLTSPKQQTGKLPRIKSILNYMKRTIYTAKIDFDRQHKRDSIDAVVDYSTQVHEVFSRTLNCISVAEFKCYVGDIRRTLRAFLSKIPYKAGEWENIYVSCLLSFLNSITLRRQALQRIHHFEAVSRLREDVVDKLYKEERENSTILYHLPEYMRDYVTVLVNSLRKVIANDLSTIIKEDISPEAYTKSMIVGALQGGSSDEN